MQCHVLTPFSRTSNKKILIDHLRPQKIIWHPICHAVELFQSQNTIELSHDDWIIPYYIDPKLITGDPCYQKLQRWIDTGNIIQDDYYSFMCDDDGYQDGFFDKIRTLNADAIIVSAKRGTNPDGFDIGTLWAKPENMKPCYVSLQQLIVKGRLLRNIKFQNICIADGIVIEGIVKTNTVHYEENLFSYFNYFQPGRWL